MFRTFGSRFTDAIFLSTTKLSIPVLAMLYRHCSHEGSTRRDYAPVNLDRIQHWIDTGRLSSSPESPITAHELTKSNCVHGAQDGIKVLGDVRLKHAIRETPA